MADLDPADQAQAVAELRDENGAPVIWLTGDLDMTSVPQARAAIDAALASHPSQVILDASRLNYLDSSGIALLAVVASTGWEVQVRNPTLIVQRLIELTGLSQILRII
jgi:anti-sigma B factor antagonist